MLAYRQLGRSNISHQVATRKRHPLLRMRYVALIVICGWAAFYYLHTQRPQLVKLQVQHQQLQSQLHQLQTQHKALEQEKQQLNSNSYIMKYATEHLGLTLPDQVPFDLQKPGQHG